MSLHNISFSIQCFAYRLHFSFQVYEVNGKCRAFELCKFCMPCDIKPFYRPHITNWIKWNKNHDDRRFSTIYSPLVNVQRTLWLSMSQTHNELLTFVVLEEFQRLNVDAIICCLMRYDGDSCWYLSKFASHATDATLKSNCR